MSFISLILKEYKGIGVNEHVLERLLDQSSETHTMTRSAKAMMDEHNITNYAAFARHGERITLNQVRKYVFGPDSVWTPRKTGRKPAAKPAEKILDERPEEYEPKVLVTEAGIPLTPAAKKLAVRENLDIEAIEAEDGIKIRIADVRAHIEAKKAWIAERTIVIDDDTDEEDTDTEEFFDSESDSVVVIDDQEFFDSESDSEDDDRTIVIDDDDEFFDAISRTAKL